MANRGCDQSVIDFQVANLNCKVLSALLQDSDKEVVTPQAESDPEMEYEEPPLPKGRCAPA